MKTQVHVIICGQVQGVWYRASTKQKADELGVTGWVKNTKEGNVEAVFEGEESLVDEMIAWCWNGPPLAHVTEVKVIQKRRATQFIDFSILRD